MTAIVLALTVLCAVAGCAGPAPRSADQAAVVHHYVHEPWPYAGMYPYWWYGDRTSTVIVPAQPAQQAQPQAEPRRRLNLPKRPRFR
ncbi:MAG: hypothetical protein HY928_12250 [Elusimicrobia bacterium]|nr:hypothetical protein [Elusimicrobiota bacterium]